MRRRRRLASALACAASLVTAVAPCRRRVDPLRPAAPAPILGSGSTYVGLAMKEWTAAATTRGLDVTYQPAGSPQGLGPSGTPGSTSPAPRPSSARWARAAWRRPRLPVRSGRRRRGRHHVQRQRPGGQQGRLPPAVAQHRGEDLHGLHLQVVRPADHARPRRARSSCRTSPSRSSSAAVSPARRRCSTTSCRTREPALFQQWAQRNRFSTTSRIIQLDTLRAVRAEDLRSLGFRCHGQLRVADEVGDHLRRVRLRHQLQRRVGLDPERVGQLGAPLRRQHLRRAGVGPAATRPQPGAVPGLRQPTPGWPTRSRPTATS